MNKTKAYFRVSEYSDGSFYIEKRKVSKNYKNLFGIMIPIGHTVRWECWSGIGSFKTKEEAFAKIKQLVINMNEYPKYHYLK